MSENTVDGTIAWPESFTGQLPSKITDETFSYLSNEQPARDRTECPSVPLAKPCILHNFIGTAPLVSGHQSPNIKTLVDSSLGDVDTIPDKSADIPGPQNRPLPKLDAETQNDLDVSTWEQQRLMIQKLYIEEDRTLEFVQSELYRHGFKPGYV